jgi:hypothetical protein
MEKTYEQGIHHERDLADVRRAGECGGWGA